MKKLRKKKFRNIYAVTITIILISIAVFAAVKLLSVDRKETPMKVSVIVEQSGNPKWKSFLEGLNQAANDENVELYVVLTSSEFADIEVEKELIDQEIAGRKRDGLILSLCDSDGGVDILKKIYGSCRIALIDSDVSESRSAKIPAVLPDALKQGKLLLAAIKEDYGNELSGMTVSFLAGNQKQLRNRLILEYLTDGLKSAGCKILWTDKKPYNVQMVLKKAKKTDILVALDDDSLSNAADFIAKKKSRRRNLYGIGCSTENVYYLERRLISGLVVDDGFSMGYESMEAIVKDNYKDVIIDSRLVRPDEVFEINNEKLLFP